ncbi:MAG: hydrogenase formation protein HypD [Candidatus Zixiibacteriota bacterium]
MKYFEEYRSPQIIEEYIAKIKHVVRGQWNIMEVCGGQTHAIFRYGIDQLLPSNITLLHGPGCPVCVTPAQIIDQAIAISLKPDVIFCTFGDMIRVPGNDKDLISARGRGAIIKIVYSPLDAVTMAQNNLDKEIVFFAIGFETTAPLNASAVLMADKLGIKNFSILNGMVRIPPAIEALLSNPQCRIDAFLAPGHVCTITGLSEYESLVDKYHLPIVATGFEPVDLIRGIYEAAFQLENGQASLGNQYSRAVNYDGNKKAQFIIDQAFNIIDRDWRGLGNIKNSGYVLKEKYKRYDATSRFNIPLSNTENKNGCIVSDILRGLAEPNQCPEFGNNCQPEHPLGPMMVSSEGACAAYYKYRSNYAKR